MKITIGGQDFTSALDAAHPLTIERKLNEPSVCQLWITPPANSSAAIARNQSIQVIGDDGTYYFTGYVAATPLPEYAGLGLNGPRYRLAIEAVSDEYLLDQIAMAPGKGAAGLNAGPLVASLVNKTGSSALSTQALSLATPVTDFSPEPGAPFSVSAGRVASQARATYRALNGAIALSALPATVQTQALCIAGFQVTAQQGTGAVSLQPMISGSPAGALFPVNPANQYALRVRVHCPECQRGLGVYRSYGDNGAIAYGGQWNTAPANLLFEVQEFVNGVAGMPVILYDGQIASLPGTCSAVAASSINLFGSMRAVNLTNLGSGWVVTTPSNGTATTRRVGSAAQSAECRVESTGRLVFYPGFVPPAGEQIAVSYRAVGRAVGRAVNTASQEALVQAGLPPVSAWMGSVTNPAPRSSEDSRNAALAMEEAAASTAALWSGTYRCTNAGLDADAWPGDALGLDVPSANLNAQVIVRAVKLIYTASYPDLVQYAISFANDWADDLAIKTGATVPADAWLPAAIAPTYSPNLNNLSITAMSGNNVTINTGALPPTGGGFEIRRRDNCFMPGTDPDLVMRGSQQNMTFTRVSASDRFYIRMYDGQNPPNYSEFSAALIFNLPLGSGQ